jgi:hypothetical protein
MSHRCRIALWSLALLGALASPAWAQKTDTVVLANGDRFTCDVKLLQYGQLKVTTDDLGTVYIEWGKIAAVTTSGTFQVETATGLRLLGQLATSRYGSLDVITATGTVAIDMPTVVYLAPIGSSFWSRLDGNLDLGLSYTQSSGVAQLNVSGSTTFRRPNQSLTLSGSSNYTHQENADDTWRQTVQFSSTRSFRQQALWMLLGGFDRNPELGYNLRSTVSAALGRYLRRSNRAVFGIGGGLSVNEELPVDGDAVTNIEALMSVRQSYFTYDFPKTSMTTSADVLPSLSQWGRLRVEFNSSIKREVVHDFTIGLTAYDSYDSRPPTAEARKNDIGFSLTIGWTF